MKFKRNYLRRDEKCFEFREKVKISVTLGGSTNCFLFYFTSYIFYLIKRAANMAVRILFSFLLSFGNEIKKYLPSNCIPSWILAITELVPPELRIALVP